MNGTDFFDSIKEIKIPKIINIETVIQAKKITNYFLDQKFILSGYSKQGDASNFSKDPIEVVEDQDFGVYDELDKKNLKLASDKRSETNEKNLLMLPGKTVFLSIASKSKHKFRSETFMTAGQNLVVLGLGKLTKKKYDTSRKESLAFEK
jgi:hypothetical protein